MTTFSGPVATQLYRMKMLTHALKLEKLGMKHSGGAIRPRIAKELGLKSRDSYDAFQAALVVKIASLSSQLQPGDISE